MARITKRQEFDELSQFGCAFLEAPVFPIINHI